jgi:hypothetical protein
VEGVHDGCTETDTAATDRSVRTLRSYAAEAARPDRFAEPFVDGGDIGMVDPREHLRLGTEEAANEFVFDELGIDDFESRRCLDIS